VQALIKQHEQAMAAFDKLFNQLKKAGKVDEERDKLDNLRPDHDLYAKLMVQIAEKNPKDPVAVDALLWALDNASYPPASAPFKKAKEILLRDHLKNPKIGPLCLLLRGDPRFEDTLRRVLADNPSKGAQAQAAFALAYTLQKLAEDLEGIEEKDWPDIEKRLGKKAVAFLKSKDRKTIEKEVEELYDRLSQDKEFANTTILDGFKLGEIADRELFEMRNLRAGKPAPEITGEDIHGKAMKLSDYRGKVVLLEFWQAGGQWPHGERSLVKKFAGRPFAIVGVNADEDRDRIRRIMAKEKIPWRSFWDRGLEGPIQSKWNNFGFPTLYLIDHNGIIVGKWRGVGTDGKLIVDVKIIARKVKEAERTSQK
jgi:peroxiredoxin